jgi:hypothetical protein
MKNIKADKNACVALKIIPIVMELISPQQNIKYIKFIS